MKCSAGLLVYRKNNGHLEVLIAHMGAPWWAKKDKGAWSIPKGEYEPGKDALANAKREFTEELSLPVPDGKLIDLGQVQQKNNKTVTAWAVEANLNVSNIQSNTFEMEWPPRSGQKQSFPEIDKAAYFDLATAAQKLIPEQSEFLDRLAAKLGYEPSNPAEQNSLF